MAKSTTRYDLVRNGGPVRRVAANAAVAAMNVEGEIEDLCARLHLDQISRGQFVEQCIRIASLNVGTTWAALLIFGVDDADKSLRCIAKYDRRLDAMDAGAGRRHACAGPFIDALTTSGHVLTNEPGSCPSTRDLCHSSPFEAGIHSLIATPLSINGRLFGAFTCTHDDPAVRHSVQHLFLLRRISVRATLAMAATLVQDFEFMAGSEGVPEPTIFDERQPPQEPH